MTYRSIPRGILLLLLAGASLLPAAACVVLVLSALLRAMGDATGAQVLVYASWALGIVWCVCLLALVFVLAFRAVVEPEDSNERLARGKEKWPEDVDG